MVCAIMAIQMVLQLRRYDSKPLRGLIVWTITTAILYACHYVFFNRPDSLQLYVVTDVIYVACNLAVFPLYLIFISYLFDEQPINRIQIIMLALIPVIGGIVVGCLYGMMDSDETPIFVSTYLQKGLYDNLSGNTLAQAIVHDICRLVFAVEVLFVLLFIVKKVRRYNRNIDLLYADPEDKKSKCDVWIISLVVLICIISFTVNIIGKQAFDQHSLYAIPSFCFAIILFGIAYNSLVYTIRITEFLRKNNLDKQEDIFVSSNTDNLLQRLTTLMTEEKVFLTHDLRLNDVARKLNTNRTSLLNVLHERLEMNFSEYVNRLRIEYAMGLISENPNISKKEISIQAGYSTYSSFYRNFKLFAKDYRHIEIKEDN